MRIVAGQFKGRRLSVPRGQNTRPTTDRVREALFNRLAHSGWGPEGADPIADAMVLDAFAGTGALALEALSRGGLSAVLFDTSRASRAVCQANIDDLGVRLRTRLLPADATRPPSAVNGHGASLIFLDPPYGKDLVPASLVALMKAGWIADDAVIVVETGTRDTLPTIQGITLLDRRVYGDTTITFLRALSDAGTRHKASV